MGITQQLMGCHQPVQSVPAGLYAYEMGILLMATK
jgi:hypothetical protein